MKKNQLWIFLIFAIMLGAGFFLPFSSSSWTGTVIKGVLFLTLIIAVYILLASEKRTPGPVPEKEEARDETRQLPEAEDNWYGYGEAFRLYSRALLGVVRSAMAVATSAGFYLKKKDGSLELQAGENPSSAPVERQRIRSDDLIERVVRQKSVVLEGNLPFGIHLAGLQGPEIRSFLGVPLMIKEELAGVLAVGSDTTGSFGEEDEKFLQRCAMLLVQVMILCHRGLQWEANQTLFSVHMEMERELGTAAHEEMAINCFVTHVKRLFGFERFTLCRRQGSNGLISHVYGQVDDMDTGKCFPLDAGLVGLVIKRNAPVLIDDLLSGDYVRPRYLPGENSRHGLRSFMGVPLSSGKEEAWGCLTLESRKVGLFSTKSKEIFTDLSALLEANLERIHLQERVRELSPGNDRTNIEPKT